ncbi:MAG: hypothetical protein U0744_08565 [Gemmataceae bacterium]
MMPTTTAWPEVSFCLADANPSAEPNASVVAEVHRLVCRSDLDMPGFCVIDLGATLSSQAFRKYQVAMFRALRAIHLADTYRDLIAISAARFDQQVTTKLHRDGGPDESLLLLGYEPTVIRSQLRVADYSRCAAKLGITAAEFLDRHNPMFRAGEDLLTEYACALESFRNDHFQLVVVNNSMAESTAENPRWQGVLHTATILTPDPSRRRIINSMMIASAPVGTPSKISEQAIEQFVSTNEVKRSGYDKPELADDL